VTVKFNEVAVDAQAQSWLERELQKAADKVCGWWGATYSDPLTIDVPQDDGRAQVAQGAWSKRDQNCPERAP
jgi:hypothetical protein